MLQALPFAPMNDGGDASGWGCLAGLGMWAVLGLLWVLAVAAEVYWGWSAALVYFGVIGATLLVLAARYKPY